ncbi:hypothetical protein ACFQ5N_02150 [Lutibacter holmesii]|uniref:Uncharacterized protein n=1 Tax=Lutibacter holmesii TaxID=1137985 RepID=A0ABW3WN30_9FLAO
MSDIINLDRAYSAPIQYPIGVTETIEWCWEDVTELTDTYKIIIATASGTIIETITEDDTILKRVDNTLIWKVNYEKGVIAVNRYDYEVWNVTQDYIKFKGKFEVTKTI